MKKGIIIILSCIVIALTTFAQPPQAIKYQAVVRNATGELISNEAIELRISIHDATAGGTIIYQETHAVTTNQFGLITLNIGLGAPVVGYSFLSIDWSLDPKFIEVEMMDVSDYISLGTSELMSVPYSLYSGRSADGYWGLYNSNVYYNSGNVGIGTTEPLAGLHLYGNEYPNSFMFLQSETGGDAGLRLYDGDEVKWHIFNNSLADALYIYNANNTQTVFCADQTTGKVGIGTTIPSCKLEVNGKILIGNPSKGIRMRNTGVMVDIESLGTGLALNFENGENTIMNVNSGNVGIGSSTPNAKLHVDDRIRIGEDLTASTLFGELIHEGGGTGFKINANAGGGTWADLHLQTNGSTKMFIESNGNVGIGTTTPGEVLDVAGHIWQTGTGRSVFIGEEAGSGDDLLDNDNVFVGYQAAQASSSGQRNVAIGSYALNANTTGSNNISLGYQSLYTNTEGHHNIAIGSYAGDAKSSDSYCTYVGYNTSNTWYTSITNSMALGYNTAIYANNLVRIGNSSVSSIGGFVGWTNFSDQRFKKNISRNVPGLDFILKLQPVTYNLDVDKIDAFLGIHDTILSDDRLRKGKIEKATMIQTGLIAQEVEAAAESLGYDFSGVDPPKNENDFYGLRYAEFVVPLIKSIQEQQEIIEELKLRIEELENSK